MRDITSSIGDDALQTSEVSEEEFKTFNTSLRNIPESTRTKFKELKKKGKIRTSMNQYITDLFINEINKISK